jgi:hypothetical protein
MKTDEFGGVVRSLLSAIGGYLVAKGVIDAQTSVMMAGVIVPVAVAIWSIATKRKAT